MSAYQAILFDFLEKDTTLTPNKIITWWNHYFSPGEVRVKDPFVTYGYRCLIPELSKEMMVVLYKKIQSKKEIYPNNDGLKELVESKYPEKIKDYQSFFNTVVLTRDFGNSRRVSDILNNAKMEMEQCLARYEEKMNVLREQEKDEEQTKNLANTASVINISDTLKEKKYQLILDFSTDFELRHFFPDANGRMRLLLEHFLCLKEGLTPILPYNTASFGLDWMVLEGEGQNALLREAQHAMGSLLHAVSTSDEFFEEWSFGVFDMTQVERYKRFVM
jgi:hypothetical protein